MMLDHPLQSLGRAQKEMSGSPPAAPAELAYIARNFSETIAAVGRIATATGEAETAAMTRLLAKRLREVADALSEAVGTTAAAGRGEVVTGLSAAALTRLEAEEDSMVFAEAAGIAAAMPGALRALRSQVRAGVERGAWSNVDAALPRQLASVVEMASLLQGQATRAVINGSALGRRSTPDVATPARPRPRATAHDNIEGPEGRDKGMSL